LANNRLAESDKGIEVYLINISPPQVNQSYGFIGWKNCILAYSRFG
jgi:hypothetical protein